MNVDPKEIEKFQAVAEDWWDPDGPLRTLHQINPVRLGYIQERCGGLKKKRVLDVGTGAGLLAEAMARSGADVTGIDLAEDAIRVAQDHAKSAGLTMRYTVVPVEELASQEAGQYDVVTCMEMLEHVPDPASVIGACATLVKPGGDVFFATLNRNPKSYLMAILGAEYLLSLLPRGTHDYQKFIRPSELLAMTRSEGLRMADLRGMAYDPWLRKGARLTNDVTVNYLCHCQRPAT